MRYLVLIISIVFLIYTESFLLALCGASILTVVFILGYSKLSWLELILLIAIPAIMIDLYFGYYLGTYFVSVLATGLSYRGLTLLLPQDRLVGVGLAIFIASMIGGFILSILANKLIGGVFDFVSMKWFSQLLLGSFLTMVLMFISSYINDRVTGDNTLTL